MTEDAIIALRERPYLYRVLYSFDVFANAVLNGNGSESLSSRCYRNSVKGYWYAKAAEKILDCLFSPWESDHCKASYEAALARGDAPEIELPAETEN